MWDFPFKGGVQMLSETCLSKIKGAFSGCVLCMAVLWVFSSGGLKASEEVMGASLDAQRLATGASLVAPVGGVLLAPRLIAPNRAVLAWLQKARRWWLAAGVGVGYGLWKAHGLTTEESSLGDLSAQDVWSHGGSEGEGERVFEGAKEVEGSEPAPSPDHKGFPFAASPEEEEDSFPTMEDLSPQLRAQVLKHRSSLEKLLDDQGKALPGFTHTMMLALKDLADPDAQEVLQEEVLMNLSMARALSNREFDEATAIPIEKLQWLETGNLNREPTETVGEYLAGLTQSLQEVSEMLPLVKEWLSRALSGVASDEELEVYYEKLGYPIPVPYIHEGDDYGVVSFAGLGGVLFMVAENLDLLHKEVQADYPNQIATLKFVSDHLKQLLHEAAHGLLRFEDVFGQSKKDRSYIMGDKTPGLSAEDLTAFTQVAAEQLSGMLSDESEPEKVIPNSLPDHYVDPRARLSLALSLLAAQLSPYRLSGENNAAILAQEGTSSYIDKNLDGEYPHLGHPFWTISRSLQLLAAYGGEEAPFSEENLKKAHRVWESFSPVVRRELAQWSGSTKWWDGDLREYKDLSAAQMKIQDVAAALFAMVVSLEEKKFFNVKAANPLYSLKFAAQDQPSFEEEFRQEWQGYLFDVLNDDLEGDNFLQGPALEQKFITSEEARFYLLPGYLKSVADHFAAQGATGWLGLEALRGEGMGARKYSVFKEIVGLYPYLRKLGRLAHALDQDFAELYPDPPHINVSALLGGGAMFDYDDLEDENHRE